MSLYYCNSFCVTLAKKSPTLEIVRLGVGLVVTVLIFTQLEGICFFQLSFTTSDVFEC